MRVCFVGPASEDAEYTDFQELNNQTARLHCAAEQRNEEKMTTIRHILQTDPIWCAYALADLQPAFQPYCQWHPVQTEDGEGLALIFTALDPPILLTVGAVAAVAQALAQATLPPAVFISAQLEHLPVLKQFYDFGDNLHSMLRMTLPGNIPMQMPDLPGLVRLGPADATRIEALYTHGGPYTPDAFAPYQLDAGVFYGVADADQTLVAVGGTHIVDWQEGVAAIGNMYTRLDQRGRGLAGVVLAAIVTELRSRGATNLVLNVNEQNIGAQKLYTRLGFYVHCPFVEGVGSRE